MPVDLWGRSGSSDAEVGRPRPSNLQRCAFRLLHVGVGSHPKGPEKDPRRTIARAMIEGFSRGPGDVRGLGLDYDTSGIDPDSSPQESDPGLETESRCRDTRRAPKSLALRPTPTDPLCPVGVIRAAPVAWTSRVSSRPFGATRVAPRDDGPQHEKGAVQAGGWGPSRGGVLVRDLGSRVHLGVRVTRV